MFGFGGFSTGKSTYPPVYAVVKSPKGIISSPISSREVTPSSTDSLEPAMDGPPSPERIRAYTEQMKRSSIFGNNSRTNTLSSGTSSSRSRDSISASTESLNSPGLSRKSSSRSIASNMPSSRLDRPESVQIFGRTLFSRRGRRGTKEVKDGEGSRFYGRGELSGRGSIAISPKFSLLPEEHRSRHQISGPFNFQHVTHKGQSNLPDLENTSSSDLVSEFSAIQASQPPSSGELKGIQAQDLHFENFSCEALSESVDEFPSRSQNKHRRNRGMVSRKSLVPPPRRPVSYAKSYDNLKASAPPRPPRSPLSPTCPIDLPSCRRFMIKGVIKN